MKSHHLQFIKILSYFLIVLYSHGLQAIHVDCWDMDQKLNEISMNELIHSKDIIIENIELLSGTAVFKIQTPSGQELVIRLHNESQYNDIDFEAAASH